MAADTPLDDVIKSTCRMVLDHGKQEYLDLCQTWRDIDTKAYWTIATAGIFTAGIATLLSRYKEQHDLVIVSLVLVLGAFVASILSALRALLVTDCECLDETSQVRTEAECILTAGTEEQARSAVREFVRKRVDAQVRINSEVHRISAKKAGWVRSAQVCVLVAVLGAAAFMIVAAFSRLG